MTNHFWLQRRQEAYNSGECTVKGLV